MSEDSEGKSVFDRAWERLESEELKTEQENIVEYSGESAELGERLFKVTQLEAFPDEEPSELEWIIERWTLLRLNNQILDSVEEFKGEENWKNHVRLATSDEVMLFFTLADELVRGLAGKILDENVVSDKRQNDSSLDTMTELKHSTQMDILYYSGIIDNGLKSELVNIHNTRNKLVHDLRQRHFLDGLNNLESRLERALDAISELHRIAEGYEGFGDGS